MFKKKKEKKEAITVSKCAAAFQFLALHKHLISFQVERAQQVDVVEASETADAVHGQIQILYPLQVLQTFRACQMVAPLDTNGEDV